ncbi:unnamed protein product, partial [marine sediment metagenome]
DYFRLCDIDGGGSNAAVAIHEWFERQQDDEITARRAGWSLGLATAGYTVLHADTAGITAYDTGSQKPVLGIWRASETTVLDKAGNSITVVARTASKPGTYIVPSVDSATDRDAIFECVTAGTTDSTEPTWPDAIGEQVVDNSMTWERVDVSLERGGYQGVCISATIQDNTHEYYYLALQADQSVDHGDVDGWTDGIDPNAN